MRKGLGESEAGANASACLSKGENMKKGTAGK